MTKPILVKNIDSRYADAKSIETTRRLLVSQVGNSYEVIVRKVGPSIDDSHPQFEIWGVPEAIHHHTDSIIGKVVEEIGTSITDTKWKVIDKFKTITEINGNDHTATMKYLLVIEDVGRDGNIVKGEVRIITPSKITRIVE